MPDEHRPSRPAPVVTSVLWEEVIGARLEELMYGLLDSMGAAELTWRAGTAEGITAADGGRDLEAVFRSPGTDGSTYETRYWVEAKGRRGTVPRRDVVVSVNELTAHPEVDVFVFCTNSRFSNPTRDWVEKWQESHPRPEIRLWDRDHLSRLVRDHPTVAARSLPDALGDADRLELLLERFENLGETPTTEDLQYFWERSAVVERFSRVYEVLAMFAYAEDHDDLVYRPWATLVPKDERAAAEALLYATLNFPRLALRELARPLHGAKSTETSAYLLIACIPSIRPELTRELLVEPAAVVESDDPVLQPATYSAWFEHVIRPIWSRVKDELRDTCANDCVRVSAEPHAFPPALVGDQYWRRYGVGDDPEDRFLVIEQLESPCVVGLPLDKHRHCPLTGHDESLDLEEVSAFTAIVRRRQRDPEGLAAHFRRSAAGRDDLRGSS